MISFLLDLTPSCFWYPSLIARCLAKGCDTLLRLLQPASSITTRRQFVALSGRSHCMPAHIETFVCIALGPRLIKVIQKATARAGGGTE